MKLKISVFDAYEDGTRGFHLSEQTHSISRAIATGGWTTEESANVGYQIIAAALDTEDSNLQVDIEVTDDE